MSEADLSEGTLAPAEISQIPATSATPAAGASPRMSLVILRRLVLWTITWVCIVLLLITWLTGCAPRAVELPDNSGEGSDLMLKSPCACQQLDFNSRGYKWVRSEEHTSELQSLMRISYAVFCLKKKTSSNT